MPTPSIRPSSLRWQLFKQLQRYSVSSLASYKHSTVRQHIRASCISHKLSGRRPRRSCQSFSTTTSAPVVNAIKDDGESSAVDPIESESKAPVTTLAHKLNAYSALAKARLSALVVTTTAAGCVSTATASVDPSVLLAVCTGTALCSAGAAGMNMIFEQERDSKMHRTQQRPLVTGVLSTTEATTACTIWTTTGAGILWYGTDPITTALGVGNVMLYAGLYTWMKPRTVLNTWVGAVVGAIPPVMGYTAATSSAVSTSSTALPAATSVLETLSLSGIFDPAALILGGCLYYWQLPHFFALSYMYRQDYARGGFQMVPTVEMAKQEEKGKKDKDKNYPKTAQVILRNAYYLATLPFLATACNVTTSMFALDAGIALNFFALHAAHRFAARPSQARARKVFLTSLWYLPCWCMLYVLHNKAWDGSTEEEHMMHGQNRVTETVAVYYDKLLHAIPQLRELGRAVCVHEVVVHDPEEPPRNKKSACPIYASSSILSTPVAAAEDPNETKSSS